MSEEDRAWLIEIFKQSVLAAKLKVDGRWTEDERRRWERLYELHKDEYKQLVWEVSGKQYGERLSND